MDGSCVCDNTRPAPGVVGGTGQECEIGAWTILFKYDSHKNILQSFACIKLQTKNLVLPSKDGLGLSH